MANDGFYSLPGIADFTKNRGRVAGGAGAPAADASAELDEVGNEPDFVGEELVEELGSPAALLAEALGPGGF